FPAAVRVRVEREHVANAVSLDVAADRVAGLLDAADLLGRLPGAPGPGGSSRDKGRHACVPNDVDLVLEGRGGAVVRPHDLPADVRLVARPRRFEIPGPAPVWRSG